MTTPSDRQIIPCQCSIVSRLDGPEATAYAAGHLRVIERGRDSNLAEAYQCDQTATSWVLDFPFRHWAEDRRGIPRLRRLPLGPDDAPVGALD